MADITITAANVKKTSSTSIEYGIAGATVTAGQPVYKEAATSTFKLSDNDSATAEVRAVYGVALNGAGADQPLAVAKGGNVAYGAIFTAGVDYYLSGTAGGICPRADVVSTDDPVRIGIAASTSLLTIDIADPDVTL